MDFFRTNVQNVSFQENISIGNRAYTLPQIHPILFTVAYEGSKLTGIHMVVYCEEEPLIELKRTWILLH